MAEYYLGIDVGWDKTRRSTGLCLISVNRDQFQWECCNTTGHNRQRLTDLLNLIPAGSNLNGVGIDGPLVSGLRLVDCYRAAEALLFRDLTLQRCRPGQTNSGNGQKLHHHASLLGNLVLQLQREGHLTLSMAQQPEAIHGSRIVEAFPNAFLAMLLADEDFQGLPDGQISDQYWEVAVANGYLKALINHLAPGRNMANALANVIDHDHRAAFICALSAMCVDRNTYVAVGAPRSGDIILPPHAVWGADAAGQGSWAEPTLRTNVATVRNDHRQNNPCPNFNQARVICNGRQWMPEPEQ